MRRQWAAAEASTLGWGGIATVSAATGLARNTIAAGLRELGYRQEHPDEPVASRLRRVGGGRKALTETDPGLLQALDALVDPVTRGHPESPLRWTCKSTRKLAEELQRQKHPVTDRTVAALLKQSGYSLQANRKTKEGSSHPDRNAQFEYINRQVLACQRRRQPVVSVDTKKKELVGEFKNAGEEWQPQGQARESQGARLPGEGTRQGDPVRRVRPGPQRRLGQCGHRSRHGASSPQPVSVAGGARWGRAVSPGDRVDDHRRRRRQQQQSQSSVEGGAAGLGERHGLDPCVSVTSHPERASGTRSSIGSSASSPRTGGAVR